MTDHDDTTDDTTDDSTIVDETTAGTEPGSDAATAATGGDAAAAGGAAPAGDTSPEGDTPAPPASRPRRRRAVAGRDTGPPPEAPAASVADAAADSPTGAAAAAGSAGGPELEADALTAESADSEQALLEPQVAAEPEPQAEVEAPARAATRRRRTAAATRAAAEAAADTPGSAENPESPDPATPATDAADGATAPGTTDETPAPRRRRRPRATVTFGVGEEVADGTAETDDHVGFAPEATPVTTVAAGSPFALSFTPAPDDEALADEVAEDLAEDLAAGLDGEEDEATALVADDVEIDESDDRPRSRRRRGRRGRGRARTDEDGAEGAEGSEGSDDAADSDAGESDAEDSDAEDGEDSDDSSESSSKRRRRRRRRSGTGDSGDAEASDDDPPNTVIHVRQPRDNRGGSDRGDRGDRGGRDNDGVRGVNGSTRLEAKRQRRRDGRNETRRRPPVLTEAEFLARRESVLRKMVVRRTGDKTQVAVLEDGILVEHYVTKSTATSYAGNIYLGKVQNVLASMEAAFVDIGKGRNAVLYAGEVSVDPEVGKPQRIEQALKPGQTVLVQVTKDPVGHKGARLTSQVSLPGRFLVYVPEGPMTGISRKLPDTERSRLKSILKRIVPDDAGVIIRTAAEGASEEDLTTDVERLQAQWETIKEKAAGQQSKAPVLLHGEPDLAIKTVRDLFNEDINELVIAGEGAYEEISTYVGGVAPDLLPRVTRWEGEGDVFAAHRIQEGLAKALERKVNLPSGGSLVIDRTEALVAIDVNTGRFTGTGGNLEETVTRNNLEAAEEIARQLRLRDIGGMVIVDFIDMVLESNRELVLRRLIECLGRDRTKHQVSEVTSLGLVQLTRKRVGQGLLEAFSETCPTCGGRGLLVHPEGYDPQTPKVPVRPLVPSPAAVAAKVASTHKQAQADGPAAEPEAGTPPSGRRRRGGRGRGARAEAAAGAPAEETAADTVVATEGGLEAAESDAAAAEARDDVAEGDGGDAEPTGTTAPPAEDAGHIVVPAEGEGDPAAEDTAARDEAEDSGVVTGTDEDDPAEDEAAREEAEDSGVVTD